MRKIILVYVSVLAGVLAPVAAWQATDKVALKLTLPMPLTSGTPGDLRSSNLEVFNTNPRPPFMVPVGTTLLSLKRPVKASAAQPLWGELSMLTDGEKEGGDGYVVELGLGLQWVQIDLGASHNLHAILLWHFHSQMRAYRDVIVQVSDDENFQKGVATVYNNDHDNSAGLGIGKDKEYVELSEGRLIQPKGALGRYVRLYSDGNTTDEMSHYIEIEVYGTPPK